MVCLLAAVTGCTPESVAPQPVAPAIDYPTFTHVLEEVAPYYVDGPQQGRDPDGEWPAGTQVSLLLDEGAYSVVRTEDGALEAYVLSDALKREDGGIKLSLEERVVFFLKRGRKIQAARTYRNETHATKAETDAQLAEWAARHGID